MPQTLAEKIMSRHFGQPVRAGQFVEVAPDWAFSIDDGVQLVIGYLRQAGLDSIRYPERTALFYDHFAPADSAITASNQRMGRDFAKKAGIPHVFDVGMGIAHQVAVETGLVRPGQIAINNDSHTPTLGAVACFGTGMGSLEIAYVWATGKTWFQVPPTLRIDLEGKLPEWSTAKDLILTLIGKLGPRAATYKVIEYHGSAVPGLSMSQRMTLCNMGVELGAKTALMPVDAVTEAHYRALGIEIDSAAGQPEAGAEYESRESIRLDGIVPMVACPHVVHNVKPARAVERTVVHQAFLGTCTNGRLEDFEEAARVLKGRKVAAGVRMVVTPASKAVYMQALKSGAIETLMEAGCTVTTPGCGACNGLHQGALGDGEVCIASSSRNFLGRMANRKSLVYLGSAATVAASALAGYIADPRDVM
ncbi:MAG: 3-isopropylmalate dehydratase large subunit [Rhodospirillales bacterium]|nr:3-isopropylmalate dehydratase large subunit [Rhodospirillales bacterium]